MAWKGLALKSELAMIIGCRTLSSFLVYSISVVLGFKVGVIQRVFPLVLGKWCPFPLSDQSSIRFLRRKFGRLVFRGLAEERFTRSLPVGLHRSDCRLDVRQSSSSELFLGFSFQPSSMRFRIW